MSSNIGMHVHIVFCVGGSKGLSVLKGCYMENIVPYRGKLAVEKFGCKNIFGVEENLAILR